MVNIKFPDGTSEDFPRPITGDDVAKNIGEGLAKAALAIEVNGQIQDLKEPIKNDAEIRIITFKEEEGKDIFWHSTSHLLAMAVKELYPNAKLAIGPAIENGFYYDFHTEKPFTPEDLEKIENKMGELAEKDIAFKRKEVTKEEAKELFKDNKFKLEMVEELDQFTVYYNDEFHDLCRGPHVPSTGKLKHFKLTKVSSAYWRGDSERESLQRIYGVSYPDKKQLKDYLNKIEEAKKRDHKRIGKDLDLLSFHPEAPGMPFWHPKGSIIYERLLSEIKNENTKRGYNEIKTPILLNAELWKKSGHWDHFKENMYFTKIEGQDYAIKPMSCPGGLLIYNTNVYSYRDLPLRNAEFGHVHRHELSGVLSGLFRVRAFTQDDAHVFCTQDQINDEIIDMVDYAVKIYKMFGFDSVETYIATRPENSMGSDEAWETATNALKKALENKGMDYGIKEGEGAFYGPKIEFNIKDAIGRNWQCGTIQVDYSMSQKFEATYEGKDGGKHYPIMVHRAILGSVERFLGVLIEHFAGKFPLWLNPNQVIVLPVSDKFKDYAESIKSEYEEAGIKTEIDDRTESIPKKVRDAQLKKFNYILVVGENEINDNTVTIRRRDNKIVGTEDKKDFMNKLLDEIKGKDIPDY